MLRPGSHIIWILIFASIRAFSGSIAHSVDKPLVAADAPWDEAIVGPSFSPGQPDLVITSVGQTSYLTCRVRQLGDRKVSWIRKRDLHILTFGQLSYTNDARFSVVKSAGGDTWTLRIRSTQLRDAGMYECQVSSEPKISRAVRLKVVVSQAIIHGSPEMYIRSGSDINLSCLAKEMPEPPTHFTWYKGLNVLSYTSLDYPTASLKFTIETGHTGLESHLLIRNAMAADSGNYTCIPGGAEPASIVVHVLNGEHPAAMQHGYGGISRVEPIRRVLYLSLSLLVITFLSLWSSASASVRR